MHTTGLKNEDRSSVTMDLKTRYENTPIISRSTGNAKDAGLPGLAATDMISAGDGEFRALQGPAGIRNDARSVQVRTWNAHGGTGYLKTEKYHG